MTLTKIKNCFNGPLPTSLTDDELYKYFLDNIYGGDLKIYGTNIKTFTTPIEDNRMQGFFHLTTKTQKNIGMKIRMKEPRAYFINYVPTMINNFEKCKSCNNDKCNKIKIWTALTKIQNVQNYFTQMRNIVILLYLKERKMKCTL